MAMAKLTREDVEKIVKEAREKKERPDFRKVDLIGANLTNTDLNGSKRRSGGPERSNAKRSSASCFPSASWICRPSRIGNVSTAIRART